MPKSEPTTSHELQRIRVVLVDDSRLTLRLLERGLSRFRDLEVVGTATDGSKALSLVEELSPDVICTDLKMPGVDGLDLVRQVMAERPTPIVVVSGVLGDENHPGQYSVFELIKAGALDVCAKPRGGFSEGDSPDYRALARRLRVAAGVTVFRRKQQPKPPRAQHLQHRSAELPSPREPVQLIVMGASTGGPAALLAVLSALPGDLPVPVLVVQHIATGFIKGMAQWLSNSAQIPVKLADDRMVASPGSCIFAPDERHLIVDANRRVRLLDSPPMGGGHKPSVDALFQSAADTMGAHTLAVLLTGMGRDGAAGMGAIKDAGGLTIAQDAASCTVFGMPSAAIAKGNATAVLPLAEIGPAIARAVVRPSVSRIQR
jgi:two-component system chemotaxis response regulator CheB